MQRVDKPWGYELIWAVTPYYAGKILHVKKDERLSLQYHKFKHESMYVLAGVVILTCGKCERKMIAGDTVEIEPTTLHRIRAIEDADIIEVSTPELNDIVRVADDYGRVH